jgi:hypothetical protein
MGECSNDMTLHGYPMLIDLIVRCFAKCDSVSGAIVGIESLAVVGSKPKVEAIKKMKTRRINEKIGIRMILRAEEDGRCENSLKALDNSPIMATIRSEPEEIEHLKGSFKVDGAAFLLDGESGYPNGDQAILAEGQAKVGVRRNLQKEFSVSSPMGQLTTLRAAERQAAEDKRPRMEGEFLSPLVALLAGELDGIELPESPLRYPDGGKTGANCGRNGRQKSVSVRVSVDPVNQVFSCHSLTHRGRCKLLKT